MEITFSLRPVPPFRLDLTAWVLRRRPNYEVDRWDGTTYRRLLVLNGKAIKTAVRQTASPHSPRLQITLGSSHLSSDDQAAARKMLERMFGLRNTLDAFYQLAAQDSKLGPLVQRFLGLKPPRYPTVFEALVNGIACQQITLTLGLAILNRLAEAYGPAASEGGNIVHAFPRPKDLASLEPEDLRRLGFSYQKGRALIELARAVTEGSLDLEGLASLDNEAAANRLREQRGVGRWTAEYVLLRGLGRLDVFPGDDVGARNNLRRWLKTRKTLDYAGIHRVMSKWSPYAGLVYFHLLLSRLAEAGHVAAEE